MPASSRGSASPTSIGWESLAAGSPGAAMPNSVHGQLRGDHRHRSLGRRAEIAAVVGGPDGRVVSPAAAGVHV